MGWSLLTNPKNKKKFMGDIQKFELCIANMLLELRMEGVRTLNLDDTVYALGHMMNSYDEWYFQLLKKKNDSKFISKDEITQYNDYLRNYCKVGPDQKLGFHVIENAYFLGNQF